MFILLPELIPHLELTQSCLLPPSINPRLQRLCLLLFWENPKRRQWGTWLMVNYSHQSSNSASKLRFMTQLTSKRAWDPTLSQSKEMACNWIEKHKAGGRSRRKFRRPADLKPSHGPASHKCHPSQIPVVCWRLSLSNGIQIPLSIVAVGDMIPDNFSHQSGD